ncbi:hypothetical protein [Streptomyces iconiensis]|uniref:Uncharacterized protein n=1 Tax=Streptomyces iconiensis TaxID=1384038 RepID=A0ABT6ZRX0_9ACTN|nr:hypothetical protein [Streptomyces iconiensis]MDJ1131248.1 hypothetical protein [Streptomyces iconiensis]
MTLTTGDVLATLADRRVESFGQFLDEGSRLGDLQCASFKLQNYLDQYGITGRGLGGPPETGQTTKVPDRVSF